MKNLKMILIALCSFGAVANKSIAAEIMTIELTDNQSGYQNFSA